MYNLGDRPDIQPGSPTLTRMPLTSPHNRQDRCTEVCLACLLALFLAWSPFPVRAAHVEDRIVAIVNSDLILWSEVKRELESEHDRIRRRHSGQDLAHRLKAAEYIALTKMIERKLQLQAAKEKGVDVSDQEVRQALAQMKLQGERIDENSAQYAADVRDQLTLLKVVDREVRSGIMVAESDMRRYFQEHRDRFALPEEYTLSQILVRPRDPDDVDTARARARDVAAALKKGDPFEDLALRYSDGLNASRGGRLGLVRQGELLPAIERAISGLAPGEISDIIETPEGFHIIRVDEKKPKQFRPFEEVKMEIQALVYQQKSEDMFQSWIADLKNKAYIEIKF